MNEKAWQINAANVQHLSPNGTKTLNKMKKTRKYKMKSIDIMSLKSFFSDPSLHSHRHHLFSVRLFFLLVSLFIVAVIVIVFYLCMYVYVHGCMWLPLQMALSISFTSGFVCMFFFFFTIRFYSASPHISILLLFWKCCYVQHSRRDNHCSNVHALHVNSSEKPPPFRKC